MNFSKSVRSVFGAGIVAMGCWNVPAWSQSTSPETVPIYRITVVSQTTKAINYRHRNGSTKVDFTGTQLLPTARGEAKVESKQGYIEIEVEFDDLSSATQFGSEYLTYVMWAITPEGRATSLGEVLLNGTKSKLNVTTDLQAFGMVITAEPHFAVTRPSNIVVMENTLRTDTVGKIEQVDAKYELLERGQYSAVVDKSKVIPFRMEKDVPLELYEAQNAVRIAEWAYAERYASETFQKATSLLKQAEAYQARNAGKQPVVMTSREAAQTAEDARLIAVKRMADEQEARERQAATDRENEAHAKAAAESERRARAEADRLAAERVKQEALQAANLADRQRTEAEAARAAAQAERQAAQRESELARKAAADAEHMRAQAEADRVNLRAQLLTQLNLILKTSDTARGLIVNMSDVLFEFGKSTLRPEAREKLAKMSGIILSHPGLHLEIEGHTDSVGSDDFNQKLSEQRAESARKYLQDAGIATDNLVARGFGESKPVASNDSDAGRSQNRRVEMIVTGDIIGAGIEVSANELPQ
jgi:outer membrane protein OmpA-like peptidoglycan-associated protein